jgi:hypothetical protein
MVCQQNSNVPKSRNSQSINQDSITCSSLDTEISSYAGASPLKQNLGPNAIPSVVENIENIIRKPTQPKPPAKRSFYSLPCEHCFSPEYFGLFRVFGGV